MKNKLKRFKKALKDVTLMIGLTLLSSKYALANSVQNSKAFTGTEKLLKDVAAALLWIIPVTTAVFCVIQFVKLQSAEDEGDAKPIKKKIKIIVICGIAAFLADTMFNVILGYYK